MKVLPFDNIIRIHGLTIKMQFGVMTITNCVEDIAEVTCNEVILGYYIEQISHF